MPFKDALKHNLMGVEKESLRVDQDGNISQELHPKAYGQKL